MSRRRATTRHEPPPESDPEPKGGVGLILTDFVAGAALGGVAALGGRFLLDWFRRPRAEAANTARAAPVPEPAADPPEPVLPRVQIVPPPPRAAPIDEAPEPARPAPAPVA